MVPWASDGILPLCHSLGQSHSDLTLESVWLQVKSKHVLSTYCVLVLGEAPACLVYLHDLGNTLLSCMGYIHILHGSFSSE